MTWETSCPGQRHLERYLRGQASTGEAAAVAEHLQHCQRCLAVVAGLKAGDDSGMTLDGEPADADRAREPARQVIPAAGPSGTFLVSNGDAADSSEAKTDELASRPLTSPSPLGGEGEVRGDRSSAGDSTQTGQFVPTPDPTQTCNYGQADGPTPPHPTDNGASGQPTLEGVVVPGYEILQELGRGGMGVVYKARHVRLQRLVALKMILAGAHAGAAGLARFRAEAEAVAQLQHPNIVQIYETGEHEGRPYFSLEFVEGGTLEVRMAQSPTPPRAAAELVETLARTMDVAHQRGIVHRDLKPGNILLGTVGDQSMLLRKEQLVRLSGASDHWSRTTVPKIADFGLVKRVDDDSSQTQSGAIIGTPCYMAPEQAEGRNREIGPAADIYALGAILYELLTGRPPFKAASPIDTIRQVIEQEPLAPRSLEPRVPHDLETICLKCLQKGPARRYASAAELAADLRRFLDGEPVLARPTPAWERAWKWARRRPSLVALLGVSVAAVVGMVLFIVWHNVSLQGQLDQARAEERLAREREQEALEGQRLSRVQHESQKLLDDARLAVAARDWATARLHLTKALTTIGSEARLGALQGPAQALMKQVEQELRVEADRRASQARFQQFAKLRDEAQFLGTLYTGMDLAANLKATRATVLQALTVYGVSVGPASRAGPPPVPLGSRHLPALDSYLNDSQKTEILGDCYQLLLILAETNAQSAPGPLTPDPSPPRGEGRNGPLTPDPSPPRGEGRNGPLTPNPSPPRGEGSKDPLTPNTSPPRGEGRGNGTGGPLTPLSPRGRGVGGEGEQHLREALQLLEQALRFGQPSRAYHLRRARYLGQLGDAAGAAAADKAAAATAVLLVLDHFLVADEFYRRGNFDEAIKEFDLVLQRQPAHFWAQYLNALCLLQKHRPAEARAQFTACLAQRSDFAWPYLLRGFAQGELQAFDAAEADFQRALQLPLDECARYVLFVNRGVMRVRQDRCDAAIADLKTAIELKPNAYQAYVNLAQAYRRLKKLDLALDQLDHAVRLEPAQAHLYRLRARLHLERHEPALALKDFDRAIQLENTNNPHLTDDHVERGRLLLRERKFAEALQSFDTALHQRQDHLPAQRLRAEALFHLGRFPEVIEAFDHYLVMGKPSESVYRGRGLARAELGKYPGAIEDFTKALELQPTSAVQAYRGWAHLVCDAPKLALRDFELAIQLDDKNGDAYNGRGFVLVGMGRFREAIRDAADALRLGPPSPRLLYNAARIYAQCPAPTDLRALALIRQALGLLPTDQRPAFWNAYVRTDAALQAIRLHPQFTQLERELSPRK